MMYIGEEDRQYILNKYHKQGEDFNAFKRFIRNDALFDKASGLSGDEIVHGIVEQDRKNATKSHMVRKAKAFAYVLEHTRINCDSRDRFPHINMMDRPLNRTLIEMWKTEVMNDIIPKIAKERDRLEESGTATIWLDYDHIVPDWDRVYSLGLPGLLNESRNARIALSRKHELSDAEEAFFDSIEISYNAVFGLLERLGAMAAERNCMGMSVALINLRNHAPYSFYEALMLNYLLFILCEHIEGVQVRSLGHFDRLLFPFYERDLAAGVKREELLLSLSHYFLQFTAIGNYWNQPVFLGGCKADGTTEINTLSHDFLTVYESLNIYNPKIQIKVASNTPKEFIDKALDMIRHGSNSIVFVSDALIRRSLMNTGVNETMARTCNVRGCYEYGINGGLTNGMNYVNLLKPLEYCLHHGNDGVNGKPSGIPCPFPSEYRSFEQLFDEYKRQLKHVIDTVISVTNELEEYLGYINPQPIMSSTYSACIEKGKDCLEGGGLASITLMAFGFIADAADSLAMIYKHVFSEKMISLQELVDALDSDFEGNERLRLTLYQDRDKYGNNKVLPDSIAKEIMDYAASQVVGRPNAAIRGDKWNCSFHVARQSYAQAVITAASPNGRRRGEELSKNISSSMGQNREGATAAILSATKLNAAQFTGDACLDLGLLPSAVQGKDGLEAMYSLLKTFVERGGHAMHINVFDADTLRKAQKEPEKYQDLQIRVCGWNVLFNNIPKAEQDGFIRQAENLV